MPALIGASALAVLKNRQSRRVAFQYFKAGGKKVAKFVAADYVSNKGKKYIRSKLSRRKSSRSSTYSKKRRKYSKSGTRRRRKK